MLKNKLTNDKIEKKKDKEGENQEGGDEMKKNHGKLFWGIFLIVTLAVISLCVYLATRQSQAKQTARLVLEQIVAETEEPDIERYRET